MFFSLPFPIYLLWPEAPANNSTFMVPSTAFSKHGLTQPLAFLLAKTGKFFAAREIESLKEACLEDSHFLFLPSPTLLIVDLKTPGIWAEHSHSLFAMGHCVRIVSPTDR